MEIEFLKNGFELNKQFIAFQAITKITNVKVFTSYSNFDILTDDFTGDKVYKYCSFSICLNNETSYEVYFPEDDVGFPRKTTNKKVSIWKMIFCGEYKTSKEAIAWLNDKEKDMTQPIEKTKELRNTIISKFNEWNNQN